MLAISIIIPCYKRKNQLKRCVKFLSESKDLGKKFDYEIIIVENGPKPGSKGIIKTFKKLKIKYFWLKKRGISYPKNFGAKKAKYPVLCFCDTDVEVKKDTLWQTILTFKNNPYANMVSGKIFWQGTKKVDRPQKTDRFFQYKNYIFAESFYGRYLACFKKSFLDVGRFDNKLFNMRGEGVDLSIRFWRAGYPLLFNPKIQVYHVGKAQFSVTRHDAEKDIFMFNSIVLLLYKYQAALKDSPYHSSSLYFWTKKLFGNFTPFLILEAWSNSIEWINKNYKDIKKSKEKIPQKYDFKPFEVFSQQNRKLLIDCFKKSIKNKS